MLPHIMSDIPECLKITFVSFMQSQDFPLIKFVKPQIYVKMFFIMSLKKTDDPITLAFYINCNKLSEINCF